MEELHKPRIFISYKRADKERVFVIKDSIEQATGERCWIDLDGIESDAQFVEVIMNAIDDCEVFLFMRSAEHNKITNHRTDWTIREVNYALGERKRIVFVALDNSPLPRWFKFMFPNQQEIDAADDAKLKGLCTDLQSWLGLQGGQDDKQKHSTHNLHNGHEFVDLGLSVKWATCNVGANTPEEYGDYFAWGETEPKNEYDIKSYKWSNGKYNEITKYCANDTFGIIDNQRDLVLADDVVHIKWGGKWRIPTKEQLIELIEKCIWIWIIINGVYGYEIISKITGNSIFIPAAGYKLGITTHSANTILECWSQSVDLRVADSAYSLGCDANSVDFCIEDIYVVLTIRPICTL